MKNYINILLALFIFASCEDMFEPEIENHLELESVYSNAEYAQGLLLNGYTRLPENSWSFSDVATDDAVSNDRTNNYRKIATGQWSSNNDPFSQWTNSRAAIQYLNLFLSISDSVNWAIDDDVRLMFNDRMKGEAYGLRALFMFHLLQSHAGWSESGELLGIPIVLEPETPESDFNLPRSTFEQCMEQLYSDVEMAEELLPLDFEDISSQSEVPAKYEGISIDNYNRVFGHYFRLRMTARIAKGIRVRAALLAASPAYTDGNNTTWEQAANYAGEVLELNGGVSGFASNGLNWYTRTSDITDQGSNPAEILWRADKSESNNLESDHFPPTLYGDGRLNPTQNLVDAFPMVNGYPISDASSEYDAANPYTNRDPRLAMFILINGSTAGTGGSTIFTSVDGGTDDGLNIKETSTRTGYYLRKLLRQDVNLNPNSTTTQEHYKPRIRYTEMYLAYAEAANEAWGPTGTGNYSFSAYDVIKAVRSRAGLGQSNGDAYLESVKADKEAMRQLIRNERRLELCFEGFRFWDLRRWETDLNASARGVSIKNETYEPISVENRVYDLYMYHGPIPYGEMLKFDALIQNKGW